MPPTAYERLGGAPGVRTLVDRFYDLMDTLPEVADIRRLHAADLTETREKLYLFLCGWMGGPNLYQERYGHPRLRARHLPFPIGVRERDQWLYCMQQAMRDRGLDGALRLQLEAAFFQTADFMRNRPESPEPDASPSVPEQQQ
jgi:hemoglobin